MPKTDPTEQPHPTPPPRAWECDHCHAAIGYIERENGANVLYYRAYLFPNHFYDLRIDRRVTLLCPFCCRFTWYIPVPRYDSGSIERAIAEIETELNNRINETKNDQPDREEENHA